MRAGVFLLALLLSATVLAAGGEERALDAMKPDLRDQPSLQRGMALYMNYCMGCHSLEHARYERSAQDLGIPLDLAGQHLIFDGTRIGERMENAMPREKAEKWFGVSPPDLSLIARARSPEWLYTYLRSFYEDSSRPWGVNNRLFPDVAMPHPMLALQGMQHCMPGPVLAPNRGIKRDPFTGEDVLEDPCGRFAISVPGTMTPVEYDTAMYDLVNFLAYVAEPYALERVRIGIYVMLFLALLLVFSWLLSREYWKEVH